MKQEENQNCGKDGKMRPLSPKGLNLCIGKMSSAVFGIITFIADILIFHYYCDYYQVKVLFTFNLCIKPSGPDYCNHLRSLVEI